MISHHSLRAKESLGGLQRCLERQHTRWCQNTIPIAIGTNSRYVICPLGLGGSSRVSGRSRRPKNPAPGPSNSLNVPSDIGCLEWTNARITAYALRCCSTRTERLMKGKPRSYLCNAIFATYLHDVTVTGCLPVSICASYLSFFTYRKRIRSPQEASIVMG